ncbi:hypothetical protein LSUE1_G004220 [Lachnellula suecica]|uniref:Uncharacterized protein n=1 Tax=Lachnellula suecica TaxID=602035 RepID=A0A8T9C9V6_9HELO|nr:hypothetical protein LSUE1_G004220 [Lachnellula suecica]
MANHRRTPSVPQVRLSQPLPPLPLPLSDIPPQVPYRDDPAPVEEVESEEAGDQTGPLPSEPPEYIPMYDYLRSRNSQAPEHCSEPGSLRIITGPPPPLQPYRDEPGGPFVVDIDVDVNDPQPPPPSYNDLYREHEIEMQNLQRTFEEEDDPAERSEDICKWVVAMLLMTLTVASVGTAFNWGRDCGHRC